MEAGPELRVLATTAMIGDIVRQVGGDRIVTWILIEGELDPHSYQLVKGDDEKLNRADLIFFNGLGLEHGPSLQSYLHQSPKAVGIGDILFKQDPSRILYFKGQVDPHIWMDISLWSEMLPVVVEALSQRDPEHRQLYEANAKKAKESLSKAHQEAFDTLQAIPAHKRYLVTSHDAFNYFARAYLSESGEEQNEAWRERFTAPQGLAPDSQLSATDIQEMIDHMARYHIEVIFPESNLTQDAIRKIVDAGSQKGLHLCIAKEALYADAMGGPGSPGSTYATMILHNVHTIAKYLPHNGCSFEQQ